MTAQHDAPAPAATIARTTAPEPLYGGRATRRVTVRDIAAAKGRGEKWPMLTAYDALTARVFDDAGIPVLLVGDSAAMVVYGYDTTIPATVDDLIPLTAAVVRGTSRALVVADLPFGSYQASAQAALQAATRFLKEAGAHAVKLEGGYRVVRQVEDLVAAGIPVMAHLGLTPQSVNAFGGYRVQGRGEDGERLLHDAKALEAAGAFSVVLEAVPAELAARVTATLSIPTIGISAGPACDAQVLVWQDMAGLSPRTPKFVKRYADVGGVLTGAAQSFAADVVGGQLPDRGVLLPLTGPAGSDVGDAQAGVRLVAPVDRHQVGGQRFDLRAIAEPARVDPPRAGDPLGERLDQVGRLPVVTEDQDIQVHLGDLGVQQQHRGDMVERAHHRAAREHLRGLLGGAALLDADRVGTAGIEGQRVHAVDQDLAVERPSQLGQQVPVALPRDRGDHHVAAPRSVLVCCPGDLRRGADAGRGGHRPGRVT